MTLSAYLDMQGMTQVHTSDCAALAQLRNSQHDRPYMIDTAPEAGADAVAHEIYAGQIAEGMDPDTACHEVHFNPCTGFQNSPGVALVGADPTCAQPSPHVVHAPDRDNILIPRSTAELRAHPAYSPTQTLARGLPPAKLRDSIEALTSHLAAHLAAQSAEQPGAWVNTLIALTASVDELAASAPDEPPSRTPGQVHVTIQQRPSREYPWDHLGGWSFPDTGDPAQLRTHVATAITRRYGLDANFHPLHDTDFDDDEYLKPGTTWIGTVTGSTRVTPECRVCVAIT